MPPAFEVLLLNTAIPQIQAAQSGDTYVVPRDIAFSTVANLANGTNLLPSLTFSSDTNTGIYREGADALGFTAGGGTNQMVLTSTGLGIGTNNPAYKLHVVNDTAATNTAVDVLALTQSSTGTADSGLGAGILFNSERPTGGVIIKRGAIYGVAGTDPDDDGALTFYTLSDTGPSGFTEKMRLDSSGNLGLGVTPSAWASDWKVMQIGGRSAFAQYNVNASAIVANNVYFAGAGGSNPTYIDTAAASFYQQVNGQHNWQTAASGTGGTGPISFTQAMTLSGTSGPALRVGVTADLAGFNFQGANQVGFSVHNSGSSATAAYFSAANNVTLTSAGNFAVINGVDGILFGASAAERARITSGGYFKASNNGTYADSTGGYHEFYQTNNTDTVRVTSTSTAVSGAYGVYVDLTTDPNATDSFFLRCYGGANQRASIRSNGGLANYQANDVNLSDQRVKKDIVAAPSYWDKIKGIEIVHFKYKDQTHDDNNVGVIAQQVEQVAPEFVDQNGWGDTPEDGVPLKSIYTSDMYHAAIKALQEAMARIEKLEAEVAALKGA